MAGDSALEIENRKDITICRYTPSERGLMLTDAVQMDQLWSMLNDVAFRKPKVLVLLFEGDAFSPRRVDEAWEDITRNAKSGSRLPPQVLAAQSSLRRLIDYTRKSQTLWLGAFEGSVDLDLFGVLSCCHYRICSAATTFENHVIDRPTPPGSASVWYLSRIVGFARAFEILLEGQSFTVEEARSIGLVNAIAPSGDLDVQAISKAEHFASKSKLALSSLVLAMNNSYGSMDEYLAAVGTGFDKIYSES